MRYALVLIAAEKVVALHSLIGSLHANDSVQLCISSMASSKLSWLPFARGKLQDKAHAVRLCAACLFQSQCPMSTSCLAVEPFDVSGFDLHRKARAISPFGGNEFSTGS
ncbi:unnamed protein product [Effrenium voratum]|uniref:Uncharacterized protein n=1 Tax=Effrenium voratum TaxID=2562239 RepID=A0AA36NA84_9DINO|nr:unnamed protein product [Effrenium voratum]CAJ1451429.1 unnamed protein product [Effrenium voratum]